jgi:hypothetical protein
MASTDIAGSPGGWPGSQNATPPFVLVPANGRSILGDAANGRVFRAVATVCVVSVGVLALAVVVLKVLGKG